MKHFFANLIFKTNSNFNNKTKIFNLKPIITHSVETKNMLHFCKKTQQQSKFTDNQINSDFFFNI